MNLSQLKKAEAERQRMTQYAQWMEHFKDLEVMSVTVRRRGVTDRSGVTLSRDGNSGTGAVNSLGFSQALSEHMTAALKDWIKLQRHESEAELKRLGVTIEA